jgi:hypothetical protein
MTNEADLPRWGVDISLWPDDLGHVEFTVVAASGPDAIRKALDLLELKEGQLLHTIHAHIGPPYK